jgi:hypothetical protein
MTDITPQLNHPADELGRVRAQIKQLKARESELTGLIVDEADLAGEDHVDGVLFGATIVQCKGRKTTAWKIVATKAGASPQLIAANTKLGAPSVSVRTTAVQNVATLEYA